MTLFLVHQGRDYLSSAQTAFLLVGFVWANDKSCSSLVQFVQFIFEVVRLFRQTPLAYTSFCIACFPQLCYHICWLMLLKMLLTFHLVISTYVLEFVFQNLFSSLSPLLLLYIVSLFVCLYFDLMVLRIFIVHRTVFAFLLDVSFYNLEVCTCFFAFDYFLKS